MCMVITLLVESAN